MFFNNLCRDLFSRFVLAESKGRKADARHDRQPCKHRANTLTPFPYALLRCGIGIHPPRPPVQGAVRLFGSGAWKLADDRQEQPPVHI